MDAELEKLVESGKLTTKAAEQLEQLRPGSFCLHKSWGFGQVAEWNLLLNQIVIDFKTKAKHPMQLAYAAENLTPIPAGHFLARKVREPDAVKAALKSDPAAVVRNILEGFDGKATLAQISEVLVGDLFTETEWKRWWTSAKKAMKSSGYFSVPAKKSEPIALRGEPVSRADELLTFFNQTRQSKSRPPHSTRSLSSITNLKIRKRNCSRSWKKSRVPLRKIKNCIPRSPSSLSWREMICSRAFRN